MDPSSGTSSAPCTKYGYPNLGCPVSSLVGIVLDKPVPWKLRAVGQARARRDAALTVHLLTAQTVHILLAVEQPLQTRPLELAT